MKKIINILFVSIIVLVISCVCLKTKAVTYQKGDLRCPTNLVNPNVKCVPITDSSGRVVEADITYEFTTKDSTTVTLTKKVKKTDVLGRYSVQFVVAGDGSKQKKKDKKVYIDIIHDVSGSQKYVDKFGTARQAIVDFSKQVFTKLDSSKTYISINQFASTNKSLKKDDYLFIQEPFNFDDLQQYSDWIDGNHYSHIDVGLEVAWNKFDKKTTKDDIRIAVFFVDGGYLSSNKTVVDWKKARTYLDKFENAGIRIYVLRYQGWENKELPDINNRRFISGALGITWEGATPSRQFLWDYAKNNSLAELRDQETKSKTNFFAKSDNYVDAFNDILDEIKEEIEEEEVDKLTSIEDVIGDDFNLSDGTARQKVLDMGPLVLEGKSSEVFYIDMNTSAQNTEANKGGWHKTNEDFKLTYSGSETETIVIEDNPEVYWVNNNEHIYSCSGDAKKDTTEKDDYPYYSKECNDDYKVRINVDDAKDGQKSFSLLNGRGFPTTVNLSTDIKCTYKFKAKEYNEDLKKVNSDIEHYEELYNSDIPEDEDALEELKEKNKDNKDFEPPTTTKKEVASKLEDLYDKKETMEKSLDNYKNLVGTNNNSSPDIDTYKDNFTEQITTIKVYYDNSSDYDELDLATLNDPKITGSCNGSTGKVADETVMVNKACTFHFEKQMGLPEACLSMVDSDQVECSSSSNQLLSGGNKFYVDLEENAGSVYVIVPDAGYHQDSNFILDKDEKGDPACEFSSSINRLDFRQIELDDPFLKEIDPKRGVGKNYLNNTFNFEKIIHGDIWNSKYEPEYYYLMSKTNIAKIKSDTSSDPSGSYLGQSCYFTNNNKWYCHFARNELEGGSDNGTNWFYQFKAYDGIN